MIVAIGLVVALWKVARAKPSPEPGVVLSPSDAPELWSTVRELADAAQTRVPDEIRLITDVNAAVSEETRLLGLIGGKRHLYIGIPLLQAMSVAQMRSILGHELGHYSQQHTRLGAVTYRGRSAIMATVQELSGNLVGWFLKQYAKLYVLVSAAVSRRQELEADQISVRVAGRSTAQSALREVPLVDTAWTFYERQYIGLGWENGYAPTSADVFGGFARLLEARDGELASMREETPTRSTRAGTRTRRSVCASLPWRRCPRARSRATSDRPVRSCRASRSAAPRWPDGRSTSARAPPSTGRRSPSGRCPRPSSGTPTSCTAARRGSRASRRRTSRRCSSSCGPDAWSRSSGSSPRRLGVRRRRGVHPSIETLLGTAAVRSGVGTWRLSWSGPAQLVGPDGEPLPSRRSAAWRSTRRRSTRPSRDSRGSGSTPHGPFRSARRPRPTAPRSSAAWPTSRSTGPSTTCSSSTPGSSCARAPRRRRAARTGSSPCCSPGGSGRRRAQQVPRLRGHPRGGDRQSGPGPRGPHAPRRHGRAGPRDLDRRTPHQGQRPGVPRGHPPLRQGRDPGRLTALPAKTPGAEQPSRITQICDSCSAPGGREGRLRTAAGAPPTRSAWSGDP
ncbi:M48 family metalloprotease [Oerskovia sp. M15]